MPFAVETQDAIGNAIGLHFERYLHVVTNLFIGRGTQLKGQLVAPKDVLDLRAERVGVVSRLDLELEVPLRCFE